MELNPGEQPARVRLAEILIAGVRWDTHHLPAYYLGDPARGLADAAEAMRLTGSIRDPQEQARLRTEIRHVQQLVEDWCAFQAEGSRDFDAWCRERGRTYSWVRHFYYDAD